MEINTTIETLIKLLDGIAPFSFAETWDNSGLQVGDLSWPVRKVMVCLDVSYDVMEAAEQWGADLVLSHHPLIFKPMKCIYFGSVTGKIILKAALGKISIISLHTNFDKADKGLNDLFASIVGLSDISYYNSFDKDSYIKNNDRLNFVPSISRIGRIVPSMTLDDFACHIKEKLDIRNLRVIGRADLIVKTVMVCTGSGGSLINDFFKSGADVFVTGDIKYHEARSIEDAGLGLIDVGHFSSEHIGVDLLANRLYSSASDAGVDIEIRTFDREYDPFRTI